MPYKEIDYCLGRSWVKSQCFRCGGCPTKFHIKDIVLARQTRNFSLDQFKGRVREAREARGQVSVLMDVGLEGRGVPRKMVAVALARAIMKAAPDFVPAYQGFVSSRFSNEDFPVWITGFDSFSLSWTKAEIPALLARLKDGNFIASVNSYLGNWGRLVGESPNNWLPQTLKINSPVVWSGEDFLKAKGLKFTLRKNSGSLNYEFSKDSIKKEFIKTLTIDKTENGVHLNAELGKKFDPVSFLQAAFKGSSRNDWVRANCVIR